MSESPHPALRLARHGKNDDGDRFVGLWVEVMVAGRQGSDARRVVKHFFRGDVAAALDSAGPGAFAVELRDAARIYVASCLTDPQYTSTMFGMKRLADDDVRAKIANETARALSALGVGQEPSGAELLPVALVGGYRDALGPGSEEALRAALGQTGARYGHLLT
ncbi:DUF6553 family protein [Tessaracoccus flavus]|uniref:Uncharacterized protein n=1 Tax=Tessaracoccus flavus TaxID=1610493 RepID=A0A1Q2CHL3_9ACTN|nr:DUF6553 family protein [Tessaracoccus flavus]AQP45609.1 hypothetical protein RPIT_12995 [Tessaracoccus flavus]SDY77446.1 hypothetical protein SAMN05428934_10488 [Tessaracoccus flavus]